MQKYIKTTHWITKGVVLIAIMGLVVSITPVKADPAVDQCIIQCGEDFDNCVSDNCGGMGFQGYLSCVAVCAFASAACQAGCYSTYVY